jgi:hypothetical protein
LIRLPLLPDSAPGIIGVRGSAVPAIDVGRLAGEPHVTGRSAILAGRGKRRIALLVDSVDDTVEAETTEATLLDLARCSTHSTATGDLMTERRNGRTAIRGRFETRIDGTEWFLATCHLPIAARKRCADTEIQGEMP